MRRYKIYYGNKKTGTCMSKLFSVLIKQAINCRDPTMEQLAKYLKKPRTTFLRPCREFDSSLMVKAKIGMNKDFIHLIFRTAFYRKKKQWFKFTEGVE